MFSSWFLCGRNSSGLGQKGHHYQIEYISLHYLDWWLCSIDVIWYFRHSFLHRNPQKYKLLIDVYLYWGIPYVLWVTHYWNPMTLVWFEIRLSIWIFRLKLQIMGISLSYLLWVTLTFSYSTLVYYQFSYFHIDCFISCFAVDNSLGLDLFLDESYWVYSQSHVGH